MEINVPRSAFLVLGASLALCACQSSAPRTAPSANVSEVVPPAPSVSTALAFYSGIWKGAWDNYLDTTLIVKRVTPPTAVIVYEYGTAPDWRIYKPGSTTVTAHFVGDKLVAKLRDGAILTYTPAPNGKLDATFVNDSRHARASAVLTKQ